MKKTTLLYISMGLTLLSFQACKKDFLQKNPISSAENNTAEALLQGAYDNIYDEYYTMDFLVNADVRADNCYAGGDNPGMFSIDKFQVNSTNEILKRDWRYLYTDIKNCNMVLEFVPKAQEPGLTEQRKTEILGEAAALRAWHYFNLIRTWKEVPIVTAVPAQIPEMFTSKQPAEAVYKQIITDLEFALPKVKTTADNKGIITKGVVYAMLAKVYAQQPNPDWAKVVQYCNEVAGLGYDLVPDYASLFLTSGENNKESIWETQNDGVLHQNWITGMVTPWMWGDWKKFSIPTHTLVKAFEDEGDMVRKNASIAYVTPSWTDDYWGKPTPVINKYPDPDGKSNTYRLRYADILLLKAEALTELNQLADAENGAQFYLNKVRQRVGLAKTTATTQAALRLAIEKERQLELAFEGHRMYDLVRTNRAVAVMNEQKDGSNTPLNYNVTADKLYFPISQDEVDANPNINK
ncbi:RagB/SusD family nutrient uptake outer membrane protein [Arcticibacter sp. MXS-1]|uniref:RagB/SusD family nutrient uptake outer membrane protein n=1 Tax=Arcticibacter sp. MXS-1 TaxID=3341726 RepID=UPI0035A83015